ncbi:MAG: hypothetical protein H6736_15160 [Alphaproteobacteria bacterium]|nr:hypothetical protein [Alphaproteobacteria bacterium]
MFLALALALPASAQELVGHWTFEDGVTLDDTTGLWDPLVLTGASVSAGSLDVTGSESRALARGYTGPTITSRTLVSWVDLTSAAAGGPLTLDKQASPAFDGIVFNQTFGQVWQSGSDGGSRNISGGASASGLEQVAISYDFGPSGVTVTMCQDGVQVNTADFAAAPSFTSTEAEVHMGIRHTILNGDPRGDMEGTIEENRLYAVALRCEEIALLEPSTCDSPSSDPEACRIVDDSAAFINDQAGTDVVDEGASNARLRPSTLDGHVTVLKAALTDGGCSVSGASPISRMTSGLYAGTVLEGSVGTQRDHASGRATGRRIHADLGGGGVVGATYSSYRGERFVADIDGDANRVFAGHFVRIAGRNGIWVGVEATCATHPGDVLDAWFGEDVPNW